MTEGGTERRRPRLWPAALIVAAAAARVAWLVARSDETLNRQGVVMALGTTLVLAALALLAWLVLFSGLSRRTRLAALGACAAAGGLFVSLFRYAGVSGDLVPVFEPRWRAATDRLAAGPSTFETEAIDFPQFRGPRRDGTVTGVALARDWAAQPPREIWRRPVGPGWSGFAVARGHAVTQEQAGEQECVVDRELATGATRWRACYPARYVSAIAGDGPRATPTIAADRVFTMGATGVLAAWRLEDGERVWLRRVPEDHGARTPSWGFACSPLLVDGLVVVCVGDGGRASLAAYDARTGALVWRGGEDERAGYASPIVATVAGVRQILQFHGGSVAGHDPADGRVLWSAPWPARQPNVAQPIVVPGDGVIASAGYGVGAKRFDLRVGEDGALHAALAWESLHLKAKFSNAVLAGGLVYGLDDGIFVCLDPATGRRRWKRGRYGHGQMLLVGDLLLVQTERGEIVLVEPSPERLVELGRFRVVDGKLWNPPALAGPLLLVRTDVEAAAFELPHDEGQAHISH